jgi:hypothetical protein
MPLSEAPPGDCRRRSFGLGGAIQLQHGVDADFPDSLGEGGLLCADGEFALVFVAAEFAFDGDVRAFGGVPIGMRARNAMKISPRYTADLSIRQAKMTTAACR